VFEYPYARPPRPPTSHKTKADVTFMSNVSCLFYPRILPNQRSVVEKV
jgi:hypothetical protein